MAESKPELFTFVGDVRKLPDSFYMAVARLLLAAHDAEKARAQASAENQGESR